MNEKFLASIFPDSFVILGKRLQKFSLIHALYLHRLGCDPVDTYSKLITAVLVCSQPASEVQRTLDDKWLRLKLWVWGWRLGKFDVDEKIKAFNDYIEHHSQGPEVFEEDEHGGVAGAPWLQHVRVTLLSRGWKKEDIATESYGLCLWDYYTYWENEGRAALRSPEVDAMRAWGDANHEEILRQANAMLGIYTDKTKGGA